MKLTYQGLELEVPYDVLEIERIELWQRIGEHTRLSVALSIDENEVKGCIEKNVENEKAVLWEYNKEAGRQVILAAVKLESSRERL